MAQATSTYSKIVTPENTQFRVTPALSPTAGFSILRGIVCLIPAWIITKIALIPLYMLVGQEHLFSTTAVAIGTLFLCYKFDTILKRWILKRENKVRCAYDIEINANNAGLNVPSTKLTVRRPDMHRLVIKNTYDKHLEMPMSQVIAAGSPVMVGSAVAANAMTNTLAISYNNKIKALSEVSYLVTVEAGGVSHIIAGGLTEVCAYGLMTDIDHALNG